MTWSIRTVTPAPDIATVILLDEAKAQLGVDHDEDDLWIEAALRAAQDAVERYTGQALSPRACALALDGFPCLPELIALPREPVTAVTEVAYTDTAGDEIVLDEAAWRWGEASADVVKPAFGAAWPTAAAEPASVRVAFECGYGEGLAPPALVAAVKMLLGHLYGNREAVVTGTIASALPMGVEALCAPFRRMAI